jgi:hypothetical protein
MNPMLRALLKEPVNDDDLETPTDFDNWLHGQILIQEFNTL